MGGGMVLVKTITPYNVEGENSTKSKEAESAANPGTYDTTCDILMGGISQFNEGLLPTYVS
jgi:hypothetical protein